MQPMVPFRGGWNFTRQKNLRFAEFPTQEQCPKLYVLTFVDLDPKDWRYQAGLNGICASLEARGVVRHPGFQYTVHNIADVVGTWDDTNTRINFRAHCQQELMATLRSASQMSFTAPVLIVLPENPKTALYAEVKRWSDCVIGLPTTCIKIAKLVKAGEDSALCDNVW
jgi:hypothetical protein